MKFLYINFLYFLLGFSFIILPPSLSISGKDIYVQRQNIKQQKVEETSVIQLLLMAEMYLDLGNLGQVNRILNKIPEEGNIKFYKKVIEANLAARLGEYTQAITLYEQLQERLTGKIRFRLIFNHIQTLRERSSYYLWQASEELDPQSLQALEQLAKRDRQTSLQLARDNKTDLEIASILFQLSPTEVNREQLIQEAIAEEDSQTKIETLLALGEHTEAIATATRLNEPRFLSWVYGEQGKQYLQDGKLNEALASLRKAQLFANQARDHFALAQWQGHLGRLHQQLGRPDQAKVSYQVAVYAIEQIRKDVAGYRVNPLLYQQIQPILRDYLKLLLKSPQEADLKMAIKIQQLELLSELDSYFRSWCDLAPQPVNQVRQDTAIIYTIILDEQLHLIVRTDSGYYHQSVAIAQVQLNQLIYDWRKTLADPVRDRYIDGGRALYDLLIQPIHALIEGKKRLVFIQDGRLRTVPMAALIDQHHTFLLERYAISYSLGLSTRRSSGSLKRALVAGVVNNSIESLPNVNQEVMALKDLLRADVLLGSQLSKSSLQSRLQTPYDVLHLATRNQLESNVEQSRLTLGTQEITLLEFEQLLRQRSSRITFLNLSACDTATGNPAAVLGLTGIGFRTGIDNTMGSLWAVSDQSTVEFMIEFYRQLQQTPHDFSESLRQAQLQAINQDSNELRPFSWAGFILLTNHYE
ncbi:hypothetical protein C7H19_22275 [Aphanothece hegewaldii CCALA 016]|uniref:CHAT domain-containing protein n=1 Tax=Aphanothece hegewaldii CCALA 016 TaxID=2107694 RepID=A0A2T1LRV2_9CHRO|nr:CHAT domain-containing protein [Aphanothece hegewaldii]PSF31754.1 hypothetical protein C7H19_22275 [Aphanothece hegewaldii CCALA 016]